MLIRHGLRLRPAKITLVIGLAVCVVTMTNLASVYRPICKAVAGKNLLFQRQIQEGVQRGLNETHIMVDGRNYILQSKHSPHVFNSSIPVVKEMPLPVLPSQAPVAIATVNLEPRQSKTKTLFKSVLIGDRNTTTHFYPWGSIENVCNRIPYDLEDLPKVSVIVTFHNTEIFSNLVGTIHSILQRTPSALLEELILIADNVRREDLTVVLEQYVSTLDTGIIRLMSSDVQLGLIRARLNGIRAARAPVVVCMDSHMEVQTRWLEPLLKEIKENRKTLATPYLDWMEYNEDTREWKITHGASTWKTYFDWNFVFGFQDMTQMDKTYQEKHVTRPVKSPVTIGTVFAIEKAWFTEVGEFDDGMEAWGAENLDLPIRVWLNGGRVVNVPCSHAAHYEAPNSRSYRAGWEQIIGRNYKRVAEVWLDEYKKYLYYYRPELMSFDEGDLTSRLELKKKAKYKFSWILENIYPELGMHDVDSFAHSGVKATHHGTCLQVIGLNNPTLSICEKAHASQGFYWNMQGELRFPIHIFNSAFDFKGKKHFLKTYELISSYKEPYNSVWMHWEDGPIIEMKSHQCLEAVEVYYVALNPCNYTLDAQQWRFSEYTPEYHDFVSKPAKTEFPTRYLRTLHTVIRHAKTGNWQAIDDAILSFFATQSTPVYDSQKMGKVFRVKPTAVAKNALGDKTHVVANANVLLGNPGQALESAKTGLYGVEP